MNLEVNILYFHGCRTLDLQSFQARENSYMHFSPIESLFINVELTGDVHFIMIILCKQVKIIFKLLYMTLLSLYMETEAGHLWQPSLTWHCKLVL